MPLSLPAHSLAFEDALRELETHPDEGISPAVAQSRLEEYGPNMLEEGEGVSVIKILIRQIANAMMLVKPPIFLLSPALISLLSSPWTQGNDLYLIQLPVVGARLLCRS